MPDSHGSATSSGKGRAAVSLALAYGALFTGPGFYLPFFPVFLASAGLSAEVISLIIGIPMGVRLAANPVAGILSDRFGRPRRFLMMLGTCAAVTFMAMALFPGQTALIALVALSTVFWGPMFPLTDAFAVRLARERGIDYGRARLWGSIAFIAANLSLGAALEVLAVQSVVWFIAASLAGYAIAVISMPHLEQPSLADRASAPKLHPRVVTGVIACAFVQSSHALLYTFASVHWGAQGISSTMIGFLWGVGVAAEVAVFYFGTAALKRFSAIGLILIGGVSSVIRFGLTALDPPQALLIPLMMLHAFTFAATYLGMVAIAGTSAGAGAQGRAQTFTSTAISIAMLLATLAAGPMYARFGAYAYFGSAVLALIGCFVALAALRQPQTSGDGG